MDKLEAIKIFLKVVNTGSFSKAAEELSISTSSSSRLVKELEDAIGTRLLQRSTRSLSMTEAGEALFNHYTQMLNELGVVEAEASGAVTEASGRLRVALPNTFGTHVMGPILSKYRQRYPSVGLDVLLDDSQTDLIREGIDVALRIAFDLNPAVVARRLTTIRIVICASPGYLERHGVPETPADLARHSCLLYTHNTPPDEWHLNGPNGMIVQRVHGVIRASNGEILREQAIAGAGIIMQPTFLIGEDLRAGRLVQILEKFEPAPRTAYAIYANRSYLPKKVRTFIDFLVESFGDPPWWDLDQDNI